VGFHKRWINLDLVKIRFKEGGIDAVRSYLDSPDAIITTDNESEEIVVLFQSGVTDEELIKKINKYVH